MKDEVRAKVCAYLRQWYGDKAGFGVATEEGSGLLVDHMRDPNSNVDPRLDGEGKFCDDICQHEELIESVPSGMGGADWVLSARGAAFISECALANQTKESPSPSSSVADSGTSLPRDTESPWENGEWGEPTPQIARILRVMWGRKKCEWASFVQTVWGKEPDRENTVNKAISAANTYLMKQGYKPVLRKVRDESIVRWR